MQSMAGTYIPMYKPVMDQEMLEAAKYSLLNERMILGESVYKFEEEFARFCGTKYAVSTNSGTSALFFSLMASGMTKGKEGVTTDMSFVASANCIFHAEGRPVLCDVKGSGNIDPSKMKKLLNGKTRAVIPVHLHGYPADMDEIVEMAESKDIPVIEDACQAHGAIYNGRMAGSMGHAGCFSFNPMKNMTVGGDGGMVTTNDQKLAEKVRELSDTGRKSCYDHEHTCIGYTGRLNSVNAAIGRVQLRYLKGWNEDRGYIADEYFKRLEGLDQIELPEEEEGKTPAYNKFVIRVKKDRDRLKDHLYKYEIYTDAHFKIPIHRQPIYKELGYGEKKYPGAEEYARTTLSLPVYPYMTNDEIGLVCDKVEEFFRTHK
ncbi:TPA: DegT/DnrJ/EryC1/StrS family aminotransferase [Candidatus Micrarchaeota archaeon]|nr:DegT/DnrJ/EryC1/StrS family aminotransferase [Candidatus Micrarchaeota archaeon]